MKKILLLILILSLTGIAFAQNTDSDNYTPTVIASKGGYAEVPAAKRPKPIDQEKPPLLPKKMKLHRTKKTIVIQSATDFLQKFPHFWTLS